MTRPVEWTREALDDLKSQIAFIVADNPPAARSVADRLFETCANLGVLATGRPGRVRGTYEKPVPRLSYVTAYAVTLRENGECISILRIIHGAPNTADCPSQYADEPPKLHPCIGAGRGAVCERA